MSDIKKIIYLFMLGIVWTACMTVDMPKAYNVRIKESETNPYGCWTILVLKADAKTIAPNSLKGELIYLNADSMYVLESDHRMVRINNKSIAEAQLITHKNQAGTYALTTAIFLLPNIIGAIAIDPAFLALGIPVALIGFVHVVVEGGAERNILKYPRNAKLQDFTLFARFPAGIPNNIDLKSLTLKKPEK